MTDAANSPLTEIRGTLILCDHVYRTDQGKWVIAGTYSHWQTPNDELALPYLHAYVRLQVERPGTYPLQLTMIDRSQAPNSRPMLEAAMDVVINEQHTAAFEMGLHLPELRIKAPVPFRERAPGSVIALHTLLWLRVKGIDVASCHLDFHFTGPAIGNPG